MINFLKYRLVSALFSLCLIAAVMGVYIHRGSLFKYSVDFTGGTQVLLKFSTPMTTVELKDILEKQGWHGAITREFSSHEILIRIQEFSHDSKGVAERMKESVTALLPDMQITILQSEAVGPGVGATLRWKSLQAIIFALILMLAYIAWRFWSFAFAAGAVVALFHDALIMLASFLLFDREISINVVGAILAVLGYSVNDTIVIFAQIRSNLIKMKGAPLYEIVNVSLNQTLRRTLLTSISTGLVISSLLILGGEALRDFSLILLVGIIFGTYSSVYIASSIMMLLYREKTSN